MKFIQKVQRKWSVILKGFSMLWINYFTEEGQARLIEYSILPHGGKKYLVFDLPIIAGGKVYSSIQELYDEDKAKKASKAKSNGNKRKPSKKAVS